MALWQRRRRRETVEDLSPVVDPAGEMPVTLHLVNYNDDSFFEKHDVDPDECEQMLHKKPEGVFTWIHVQGKPRPSMLRELGELFNLHPLALEDVINIGERSKAETYDNQLAVILGMPVRRDYKVINEQVSMFLGEDFLVTFHNGDKDPFKAVRRRLNHPQAALRGRAIDYLFYVLIDVIIDHGFPILEEFEQEIGLIEEELLGPDAVDTFRTLYAIKRELLVLRLKLRPHRETIQFLLRDVSSKLLSEETKIYLRDCYDHAIRLVDILEIYRDMTSNMLEMYLLLVNKVTFVSTEVQRKATVIAMIFAPITFVTGIYGMNFVHMPELHLAYGFYGCLFLLFAIGAGFTWYSKAKRWL